MKEPLSTSTQNPKIELPNKNIIKKKKKKEKFKKKKKIKFYFN